MEAFLKTSVGGEGVLDRDAVGYRRRLVERGVNNKVQVYNHMYVKIGYRGAFIKVVI